MDENKIQELGEEELDSVSGGSTTKVKGEKYVVVTSMCKCFNGQYEIEQYSTVHRELGSPNPTTIDHSFLRYLWLEHSTEGCCGHCHHLQFKGGLGYCGKSKK